MPVATFLKYLGAAVSTLLAILTLIATYREESTRRVTLWGRVMLFGIVLSGMLIIASQISDDAQREVERRDLIEQVTCGQYPIRDVRLCYSLDVANAHPDLAPFVRRFKESVATARAIHVGGQRIVPGVARWLSFGNEEASQASVCPGSHLFPNIQSEAVAYAAYSNAQVTLQIYRTPIAIHEYPYHGAMNRHTLPRLKKPDLVMTFRNDLSRDSSLCIEYDFKNQQLALDGIDLTTNPDEWKAFGKIISSLCRSRWTPVLRVSLPSRIGADPALAA